MDRYHQKVVRTGLGTLFRYGSRFGYAPLRESLVRKLGDVGISAAPSQLVLTHGANEAMDLVIRYFLPPGAAALVDDPGYYPLFGKLKLAGVRMLGVPRLSDGPDPVSYTHLDVYKRQGRAGGVRIMKRLTLTQRLSAVFAMLLLACCGA